MPEARNKDKLTFLEHLEELRWHIIRAMAAILIVAIAAFLCKHLVFDVILFGPRNLDFVTYRWLCRLSGALSMGSALCLEEIQFSVVNLEMAGQFVTHLKVSIIAGLIVAFPYVAWEAWRFVRPALYSNEKRHATGLVMVCSLLFFFGVGFGYYIVTPFSVNFLGSYRVSQEVQNTINLGSYINLVTMISLASGIIFELPIAAYFLSKIGLLTPDFMSKYRRHAIVAILLVAAVITPPDVTSQIIIAIPIFLLYEVSILVSRRVVRGLEKEAAA